MEVDQGRESPKSGLRGGYSAGDVFFITTGGELRISLTLRQSDGQD